MPKDLTTCTHQLPSDRGFFDETVQPSRFFWGPCFEYSRSYFNKSNTSRVATRQVCTESAWLTQECYIGKIVLHSQREWNEHMQAEHEDAEQWFKRSLAVLW